MSRTKADSVAFTILDCLHCSACLRGREFAAQLSAAKLGDVFRARIDLQLSSLRQGVFLEHYLPRRNAGNPRLKMHRRARTSDTMPPTNTLPKLQERNRRLGPLEAAGGCWRLLEALFVVCSFPPHY